MTIRKHDDAKGFARGSGHYSANSVGLRKVTFVTKKASAQATIDANGDRKAGFAAKLDKK